MTSIRPFGLNDIWLVRDLQRSGVVLAIEQALTHPRQPLWTALTAPWPWAGVGVATFVLDQQAGDCHLTGFVQLMKRATRPEADLLHLSPAVAAVAALPSAASTGHSDADQLGCEVWRQLLSHCSLAAASHGLQRIFASTPVGCPEEACLKEAGFSLYTRETVYRLAEAPATSSPAAGSREQLPQDSWALQRLYMRSTPRLVQQAEGALTGEVGSPMLSWWEPGSWRGIVWEPAGEVRGAVQVHAGRVGHWLRIWGTNEMVARDLRALVSQGLRQIDLLTRTAVRGLRRPDARSLPIYATVRDYEVGLSGALTGFGFAPFMDRARFVRHVLAAARAPMPVSAAAPLAAREVRQEVPVRIGPSVRWLPTEGNQPRRFTLPGDNAR